MGFVQTIPELILALHSFLWDLGNESGIQEILEHRSKRKDEYPFSELQEIVVEPVSIGQRNHFELGAGVQQLSPDGHRVIYSIGSSAGKRCILYLGWSTRSRFPSERWDSLRGLDEAISNPEFLTTGQDLQIFSGKRNTMSWRFLEIGDDIDSPDWLQRAVAANLDEVSAELAKERVERTLEAALEQLAVLSAPLFNAAIAKYGAGEGPGGS